MIADGLSRPVLGGLGPSSSRILILGIYHSICQLVWARVCVLLVRIYKSPVRQTPEQARMTPEQWLVQGLQDGPVVKNRDNLKDVRRDLSSLLGAETTPGGFTNAVGT